ncbi:unnamed protein product [Staurois parvus]|uniref:Uncharacterized protein n=1 Tax=Staurois parvus TaxID=386267 RepID=A0ABN9CCT4_9NEOB|nr:unnamed protein product [Staurois parvus]
MRGPGRPDIVNAGSGETGYSECRVLGLVTLLIMSFLGSTKGSQSSG